jgi:hypothetical protein
MHRLARSVKIKQAKSNYLVEKVRLQTSLQNQPDRITIRNRLSKKLKEWYHTFGSRAYVPSLYIDESE